MIKVGLTGGIGSGKTYIARIFSELYIPIYNSDTQAKYLMNHDPKVKDQLINAFGPDTFKQNILNRQYLSTIVFNDKSKLEIINSIVHPAVQNDFNNWLAQQAKKKYIIKEAAILIESGASKTLDNIIVVTAPPALRIKRVMERDNMTKTEIQRRIANQMTDKERTLHADFVINNDGTVLVNEQVLKIHNKIINISNNQNKNY